MEGIVKQLICVRTLIVNDYIIDFQNCTMYNLGKLFKNFKVHCILYCICLFFHVRWVVWRMPLVGTTVILVMAVGYQELMLALRW